MISTYKYGDNFVWIPVAKESNKYSARAFLPFNGVESEYLYGYKAEISKAKYFIALSHIQNAFINDESKVFSVNNGTREESQRKDKWRHGRQKNSPLLGPTKGWVKVPFREITKINDEDLAIAIDNSGQKFAEIKPALTLVEPVICYTDEELASKSDELKKQIGSKTPIGQVKPAKYSSKSEGFARDAAVVAYVLEQSGGLCECCRNKAPFFKENSEPFLEVHHVKHLSNDGSDKVTNAVAICPNCHRELHYGIDKKSLVDLLFSQVGRLIRE